MCASRAIDQKGGREYASGGANTGNVVKANLRLRSALTTLPVLAPTLAYSVETPIAAFMYHSVSVHVNSTTCLSVLDTPHQLNSIQTTSHSHPHSCNNKHTDGPEWC